MSHYLKEVLLIPGKFDFILNYQTILKKGKELPASHELLKKSGNRLGKNYGLQLLKKSIV